MDLYKFGHDRGWQMALTPDKTGSNLPAQKQAWKPFGAVNVREDEPPGRIGASADQILKAIEKDGYFILP